MAPAIALAASAAAWAHGAGPDDLLPRYRELAERFHRDALDFELCAGYVLQATRDGFWAVAFPDSLVIGSRRGAFGPPVVVAAVGRDRAPAIAAVARDLARAAGAPVTVKNVGLGLGRALLRLGARPYAPGEGWDPGARCDDNTFPEPVLDTARLSALAGQRFKKLRNERHAFHRHHRCRIGGLAGADHGAVVTLAARWAEHVACRRSVASEAILAATRVLLPSRPELHHQGIYDEWSGALVGVLATSRISAACLGFNLLIHEPAYRNAFRICVLEAARLAHEAGYRFLNLQGSEDLGQHRAKQKLRPVHELSKTHLVFDPPRVEEAGP